MTVINSMNFSKDLFSAQHPGWIFILLPAVLLAAAIILDNKGIGPYFPILDVIFNEFGSGYKWNDREILWSFARRFTYAALLGALLGFAGYSFPGIVAVFFVTGFLLIWPAFFHSLPVYASKSDSQVLLVWGLYVLSIVAAGAFGARALAFVRAISGQSTWDFARGLLSQTVALAVLTFVFTAFRVPLQGKIWKRYPEQFEGDND